MESRSNPFVTRIKKKIKMIESQPMRLYQESESWGRTGMADPKIHFTRGPFQWN